MNQHKRFIFRLRESYAECRAMYSDGVNHIIVKAECGTRVQIHKRHLRAFITHEGLQGRFAVWVDSEYRFLRMERMQ